MENSASQAVTLLSFVEELPEPDRPLAVLNRTGSEQLTALLEATVPQRDVPTIEQAVDDADDDLVVLVEDGDVIARSPLSALSEQLLFVNSDVFRIGTRDLDDVDVPEVLLAMNEQFFHLYGDADELPPRDLRESSTRATQRTFAGAGSWSPILRRTSASRSRWSSTRSSPGLARVLDARPRSGPADRTLRRTDAVTRRCEDLGSRSVPLSAVRVYRSIMSPSRIKRALSRARYAAIGAAIGGGLGGLFSRNAASSGAALGAMVGAAFGETRLSARKRIDDVKRSGSSKVDRIRPSSD